MGFSKFDITSEDKKKKKHPSLNKRYLLLQSLFTETEIQKRKIKTTHPLFSSNWNTGIPGLE